MRGILHVGAVKGGDDISLADTGLLGRTPLHYVVDQGASGLLQAEGLGQLFGDRLDRHAHPAAADIPLLDKLGEYRFGHIRRYGKSDALPGCHDGGVDADNLAVDVQQRTARIAGIDGGVGLDEILIRFDAHVGASGSRDDADRHGPVQAEGVADGDSPLADFQLVRIAQDRGRQVGSVDLDHGDVGLLIPPDDLRVIDLVVGELDLDRLGIPHHVVIGYDVAVLADDEPRSQALVAAVLRLAAT